MVDTKSEYGDAPFV
jgi:hypothetical protein